MRLGVAVRNRTQDLLHCRRTLYAKSHSNGVIDCHSEPLLVLLQCRIYWTGTGTIKDKNEDFEHLEFFLTLVEIERELV
jgi:hypothetical protein